MDWFRMYAEMMDDPKIGTLDDASFRTWVELLCTACKAEADGNTHLTEETISWALRRNVSETFQKLLQRDLVTLNETGEIVICNWTKRQMQSDSSTQRVRAHREKLKQQAALQACNANETLQERQGNGLEKRREEERREEKKEKTTRVTALSCSDLMADGVQEETANEFLALRRKKRAPLTPVAWEGIKAEGIKAGWTMQAVLTKCVARGWQGFEAGWVASGRSSTTKQAEWDASIDEFLGEPKRADPYTIEAEYARIR